MLVRPNKTGNSLFDEQDRVYISGFTNKLKTDFMDSATAQRDKITDALLALNEFTPAGRDAALYGSVLRSLEIIGLSAEQYKDTKKKRQAVLIVITNSFNGIDPERGRRLRYCSDNDKFNDSVRQKILETRQATAGNLKIYFLGIGKEGETDHYSLTEAAGRRCRITKTEKVVLDGRSLRAVGDPKLTSGGYYASEDPRKLAAWLTGQFEALKTAYQISYPPPKEAPKPSSFMVHVKLGQDLCESEIMESTSFVPYAVATSDTTTSEVALFLASLLIVLFFLPRSMMNLATLGDRPSPKKRKKKKKGKGKKRKKRKG
jgi:hypothetical protein